MKRWIVVGSALLVGVVVGRPGWAYQAAEVKGGGTISGKVLYAGDPPPRKPMAITKDKEACAKGEHLTEDLVVGREKGIQHVVVSLTDVKSGKRFPAGANYTLDQNGCKFIPHVLLVPAGAAVDILNSDGILHNFHSQSVKNPSLNIAQPKFKKKMSQRFEKPETIKIACDVHGWMSGWIVVTEHPYHAVTEADGSFKLTDIPPGTYKAEFWQESLGRVTKDVTVKAGADTTVTVEMKK